MNHKSPAPFLSMEERIQYLAKRGYFSADSLNDAAQTRLRNINFHYFLGYARNYRMLADQLGLGSPKSIEDVFQVIELDHQMADLMFSALRSTEHLLRSTLVEQYCTAGLDPYKSFLDPATYQNFGGAVTPEMLTFSIADQVLRYREPYVVKHLAEKAKTLGVSVPERCQGSLVALNLLEDLPVWAVIDSLQLGTLSRMITTVDSSGEKWLWQDVAGALEVPSRIFHTNLTALSTFRNQVAHYGRLWMKPTADTPKKPSVFEKRLRQFSPEPKSMLLNFYNVALFLDASSAKNLLEKVDSILLAEENHLYRLGVTKPLTHGVEKS